MQCPPSIVSKIPFGARCASPKERGAAAHCRAPPCRACASCGVLACRSWCQCVADGQQVVTDAPLQVGSTKATAKPTTSSLAVVNPCSRVARCRSLIINSSPPKCRICRWAWANHPRGRCNSMEAPLGIRLVGLQGSVVGGPRCSSPWCTIKVVPSRSMTAASVPMLSEVTSSTEHPSQRPGSLAG